MSRLRAWGSRTRAALAALAVVVAVALVGAATASGAPTPTPVPSGATTTGSAASTAVDETPILLEAEARLEGSGPITAWFGGKAKRTYVLTVTNMGEQPVTDPAVVITVGKSPGPTAPLESPKIGTIASGQTLQYKLPITLDAPAFGTYYVRATFTELTSPLSVESTTSTYPWALLLVGWLLLQPLMLGLYKRRPAHEPDELDPLTAEPEPAPPLLAFADDPLLGDPLHAAPPIGQEPLWTDVPANETAPLAALPPEPLVTEPVVGHPLVTEPAVAQAPAQVSAPAPARPYDPLTDPLPPELLEPAPPVPAELFDPISPRSAGQ